MRLFTAGVLLLVLLLAPAACTAPVEQAPAATETLAPAAGLDTGGPAASEPAAGSPAPPTLSAAAASSPRPSRTTSVPANRTPAVVFPTPCPDWCAIGSPFYFQRPVPETARQSVDISYRFGSTQNKAREPHHGVELLNPFGTPVLAAADGRVVAAGSDSENLVSYSPYLNFYGLVVILQHTVPGLEQPVFSLYAHLSDVNVKVGQRVQAGDLLGKVGLSGSATGSHLHFEVRLGENTYAAVRNPELWLAPLKGTDGQAMGALAGRVLLPPGYQANLTSVVLEKLSNPAGEPLSQVYLGSYEEAALLNRPPWGDTFGAGDLEPGWYRVSFVQFGMQQREVQVLPGRLTLVTFDLSSGD